MIHEIHSIDHYVNLCYNNIVKSISLGRKESYYK